MCGCFYFWVEYHQWTSDIRSIFLCLAPFEMWSKLKKQRMGSLHLSGILQEQWKHLAFSFSFLNPQRGKHALYVLTHHSLGFVGLVPTVTSTTTTAISILVIFTLLLSTTMIPILSFITVSLHGRQRLLLKSPAKATVHLFSGEQWHNQKAIVETIGWQKNATGVGWRRGERKSNKTKESLSNSGANETIIACAQV